MGPKGPFYNMAEKKMIGVRDMRKIVSTRTGLKRDDAEIAIRTVFDVVKQLMYEGYQVRIPNFAIFFLGKLRSKTMVTPYNGRTIFKEEHFTPRSRFSLNFKRQIQKKKCTPE